MYFFYCYGFILLLLKFRIIINNNIIIYICVFINLFLIITQQFSDNFGIQIPNFKNYKPGFPTAPIEHLLTNEQYL